MHTATDIRNHIDTQIFEYIYTGPITAVNVYIKEESKYTSAALQENHSAES